jgi:hypothetical protein
MSYRFRLRGNGFRHSWEKDCSTDIAVKHATQVASECAKDSVYQGAAIRVLDELGNEIAHVPVHPEAK